MKRAVLYLRVSTLNQTTANQERELREIAGRMGWEILKVYKDHGISGAKGRDKRPEFDRLCRDAAKRQFDMVMAWSVDRLGRCLQDLGVFAEFERAMLQERVRAGLKRAKSEGKRLGRPPLAPALVERISEALNKPGRTEGVRRIAARFGVDPSTVQRISRPFDASAGVA